MAFSQGESNRRFCRLRRSNKHILNSLDLNWKLCILKKPTVIAIDIVTVLAMFGISAIVSIVMKGRLGLGEHALTNQRLTNVCIISTIVIIVIAVNKFFIKYTIPVNS